MPMPTITQSLKIYSLPKCFYLKKLIRGALDFLASKLPVEENQKQIEMFHGKLRKVTNDLKFVSTACSFVVRYNFLAQTVR